MEVKYTRGGTRSNPQNRKQKTETVNNNGLKKPVIRHTTTILKELNLQTVGIPIEDIH